MPLAQRGRLQVIAVRYGIKGDEVVRPQENGEHFPCLPARSSARCSECKILERKYENTIARIASVLKNRFDSLEEKVLELHKWQDARDEAIEAFYSHKKSHPPTEGCLNKEPAMDVFTGRVS